MLTEIDLVKTAALVDNARPICHRGSWQYKRPLTTTRLRGFLMPIERPRVGCNRPGPWPTQGSGIDVHKRDRNRNVQQLNHPELPNLGTPDRPDISRASALRAVGEVVYAARVGELIKIGHTKNLQLRLNGLRADELLGFQPGTWDDEQRIHRELAVWAAKGHEWYHPAPPVIEAVNDMRRICRLEPLPYIAA